MLVANFVFGGGGLISELTQVESIMHHFSCGAAAVQLKWPEPEAAYLKHGNQKMIMQSAIGKQQVFLIERNGSFLVC